MGMQDHSFERTGYEYDTLMNMLQVSVSKHLLDEHFTLVWANDYYYDLIGYPKEDYEALYHNRPDLYYNNEALGIHDEELWNQIGDEVLRAINAGKSGYSMVSKMRRRDGDYIWVRMTARFTDEYIDGTRVSYTAMTDVSDVMRMKLEQSVTYDNLPGFVAKYRVGSRLEFTLIEANDRFFEFFGQDSIRNMDYALFRENVERNRAVFEQHRQALLDGSPVHFMVQMGNQYGKDAWLQINASCIGWQEGEPVYLVIYIDVTSETELRQMQKKLEQQARQLRAALDQAQVASRAKSDFLSHMSHDIRTPMNAILGMTDIAAAHLEDSVKVKDCLKKISLSGQHLLGLINDVLDMSKIESGNMVLREDIVSLPEILENIVTIMQPQFHARGQQFSIRLQGVAHEQFLSDSLRLRQVFLNLLSNACKFTPNGGKITMDVQELAFDDKTARLAFLVTDTGIGMQPEFLSHLFDAFSRERDSRVDKTEGTGLGMAITKRIVDLLGGAIEVNSRPGEGTSFRVVLPLRIQEMPQLQERFPDLRIIVCDDDAIMCEYTLEMLHRIGIHASWVSSGAKAIETLREAQTAGEPYDAVLLDWKMPGLDGLQTSRQIRRICGEDLPILIITAYDWGDIREEAQQAGITGFLQKPIFVSTLIGGLRRFILRTPAQPGEARERKPTDFVGKRFLLVEDNALNQEVTAELLGDLGAQVEIAGDGRQGVEAFVRSQRGYYDLILMDIQMPVMDGYTAARRIRGQTRADAAAIPILAMTADAFAEDIQAAREAGMNGHLAKPLDTAAIKREIIKYL